MSTPAESAAVQPLNGAAAARDESGRFAGWVRNHDESWLFVAIYVGLAVGLSVFDVEDGPVEAIVPTTAGSASGGRWGVADYIGVAMVGVGIILILLAPYLTPHEWGTALATLVDELRPLGPLGAGH
jgi:hypothetical protein